MFDTGDMTALAVALDPGAGSESGIGRDLAALRELVRPASLAGEHVIEVGDALRELFPRGGLTAGSVVSVSGDGATSLLWSLIAHPSKAGRWTALVGMESMGWAAAAEAGVDLGHVVMVQRPPAGRWATVVAALIDGFELLVVSPTVAVRAGEARRLTSRLRESGAVLVLCHRAVGESNWPELPDVAVSVERRRWHGLGVGHGHLREVSMHLSVAGRRGAARARRVSLERVS